MFCRPSECICCPYTHTVIFKEHTHTKSPQMLGYPPNEAFVLVYFWWKTPKSPWQASQFSQLTRRKVSRKAAYLHKLLNKHQLRVPGKALTYNENGAELKIDRSRRFRLSSLKP